VVAFGVRARVGKRPAAPAAPIAAAGKG
jgi:hypothetical protein